MIEKTLPLWQREHTLTKKTSERATEEEFLSENGQTGNRCQTNVVRMRNNIDRLL